MTEAERDLMTVKAVAKRLGVSVPKVYVMASHGDIPSVRIGKLVRFQPDDVERLIQKNRRESAGAG